MAVDDSWWILKIGTLEFAGGWEVYLDPVVPSITAIVPSLEYDKLATLVTSGVPVLVSVRRNSPAEEQQRTGCFIATSCREIERGRV